MATIFISFLLHVALFSSRITEVRDGREPKGRIKKKEKETVKLKVVFVVLTSKIVPARGLFLLRLAPISEASDNAPIQDD